MHEPTLDLISLVTADMDASIAFYRRLGLTIPEPWRTESGGHHVSAELPDGIHLDFDSVAMARSYNAGYGAPGALIGFQLPSRDAVDACFDDMTAAGHTGLQPPFDAFWGARYAIVADPDGNPVGLMSPIDPDAHGPPPPL
jgi:catechol 2,3-dioxygenase-like lactoylglutathione lyase family enzyme